MNLQGVTQALCNAFLAEFGEDTPVAFDNEVLQTEPTWMRMRVVELASEQKTLGRKGNRKFQRDCAVLVQVFEPAEGRVDGEGGVHGVLGLAEQVRRFFEGETISGAKFHAGGIGPDRLDADSGGRWTVQLVTVPFYFQETA